jgi:transcriptional regulator with XRE-family HTH domain
MMDIAIHIRPMVTKQKTAGEQIRDWRIGAEKTQLDCAKEVGVEQSTWSEWENDQSLPGVSSAIKVAEMAGLDLSVFARPKRIRRAKPVRGARQGA